ncbi:MAG: hypothetical protein JXB39_04310 [Deltaproteobacteria bacterium]|nr:hypothetical protein [Deltaproteobacteria bacterium]
MMSAREVREARFPGALPEQTVLDRLSEVTAPLGFDPPNTIACVGVCRDEIAQHLPALVRQVWGEAFNFCSLGGMLFLGRTGFRSAHHHAPVVGGRERYLHLAFSHVAIGEDGTLGHCCRLGRPGASAACGALEAFRQAHARGDAGLFLDPDDVEMSLLSRRLSARMKPGARPDLADLAHLAREIIAEDLDRMLHDTADPAQADWVAVTGIQIHAPEGEEWIWVPPGVASINGRAQAVHLA